MSDLFLLSEDQMARISPYFPLAHGVPRVDDRRVISGIVYVIKHGLQWKDAPKDYALAADQKEMACGRILGTFLKNIPAYSCERFRLVNVNNALGSAFCANTLRVVGAMPYRDTPTTILDIVELQV